MNSKDLEVKRRHESVIQKCTELTDSLITDAEKNQSIPRSEIELLKDSSLDYKLVYFAKYPDKNKINIKEKTESTKNEINRKACEALYDLYEGERLFQRKRLYEIAKANDLRLDVFEINSKTQMCPYDADAFEVLEKALCSTDITKIKIRDSFAKTTEIDNTNFKFLYRYNPYLVAYNRSILNSTRKRLAKELKDSFNFLEFLGSSSRDKEEKEKIHMQFNMNKLRNKGVITDRQLKIFYLIYFPEVLPEKYVQELVNKEEYFKKKEEILKSHKIKNYRYSQMDISYLTGYSTTIISREKKRIDDILNNSGTEKVRKTVEERLSDLSTEIEIIEKELDKNDLTKTAKEEKEKHCKALQNKKNHLLKILEMKNLSNQGKSNREIAEIFKVDISTVSKSLKN